MVESNVTKERGEKPEVVLARIKECFTSWNDAVSSLDQVEIRKLSGLSNACYKVALKPEVVLNQDVDELQRPRVVLYRKFECEIIDKRVESTIFKAMSESGLGPKLFFQNSEYRIENFIEGRPLTIWEMRNPVIAEKFVEAIFNMHTKSGIAEAMQEVQPFDSSRMGVQIAVDQWGPATTQRLIKIRSKLNSENEDHRKILEACQALEETYLKDGYQSVLSALYNRD